jgi:hypothetical protein
MASESNPITMESEKILSSLNQKGDDSYQLFTEKLDPVKYGEKSELLEIVRDFR